MKRFKNYNLTEDEWNEVFSYPKEFNNGDFVECGHGEVWEVLELMPYKKGIDNVYKLRELASDQIAVFSSTFIQPIGTFVDTEFLTKGVR
jgi:hypothetical protein